MMQRGKLMVELVEKRLSLTNVSLQVGNEVNSNVAGNLEEDVLLSASTSVPTVATVSLPVVKKIKHYHYLGLADNLQQDESDLPAATEGTPVPGEDASPFVFLEEADEQAVEIPLSLKKEKLGVTNQESARPSREKKSRGRERIQNILQQTDDSINDPLFSSDSDVYEPSSSSSDDEACLSKKINVLKKVCEKQKASRRIVTGNSPSLVNRSGNTNNNHRSIATVGVFHENIPAPIVEEEQDYIVENPGQEVQPIGGRQEKRKRRKGENVDPRDWERNVQSAKRKRGESYLGLKKQQSEDGRKYKFNNERKGKEVKDRCSCKTGRNFDCDKVTDLDRNKLFTNFWKNVDSWEAKRAVIVSLVEKSRPDFRRSTTDVENSRKNVSFKYYLKVGDGKVRVCKKMFLNTFCLGEKSVRSWVLKGPMDQPLPQENNPDDIHQDNEIFPAANDQGPKADSEKRDSARQFLNSLPKMESHYCLAKSTKQYLEPNWENKSQLHREYTRWCEERNLLPASRSLFQKVFVLMNIGFFIPKNDQCETCIKFKLGKVTEEEYKQHQSRKEGARNEKESDKKKAEESNNTLVVAVDVQKVLTCPNIKASSSYYKTKLKVHNYSIYNLANHDVTCYIWHEGNGQLDGDIFASMLVRFLTKQIEQHPEITEVVIWSDGCTNQNRCETVSNALLYVAINKKVTVYQKYLEVGHTQMEVDSVHSTIERKIKKHEHFVPADFVRDIKEARRQPGPYSVETLTYKDFSSYADGYYKSIRPGNKKGDPYVTDLRCLKYTSDGQIWYKLLFSDNWLILPRRPRPITDVYSRLKPLYDKPVPITARKFKDLQELKNLLEEVYRLFYDNLCHEN